MPWGKVPEESTQQTYLIHTCIKTRQAVNFRLPISTTWKLFFLLLFLYNLPSSASGLFEEETVTHLLQAQSILSQYCPFAIE